MKQMNQINRIYSRIQRTVNPLLRPMLYQRALPELTFRWYAYAVLLDEPDHEEPLLPALYVYPLELVR